MKACKMCGDIKFWFQFVSESSGLYTETFNVCKKCAKKLRNDAVRKLIH